VAHHGSDTSSGALFVGTVSPSITLISSGKENKYGHPHQSVLDTLKKVGAEVYRTDKLGTIQVVSDGEKVWVEN
jgi:competence protein ComEC